MEGGFILDHAFGGCAVCQWQKHLEQSDPSDGIQEATEQDTPTLHLKAFRYVCVDTAPLSLPWEPTRTYF